MSQIGTRVIVNENPSTYTTWATHREDIIYVPEVTTYTLPYLEFGLFWNNEGKC